VVFRTNVMSTFNVPEAATALGINRVRLRIERVRSWTDHATLLNSAKAEALLGFRAMHSWRSYGIEVV
jgi:hypothetical protein